MPANPPLDLPTPAPASSGPRLLVSVRGPVEARAALAGGADIIDVKEPAAGPLGRADGQVVQQVLDEVAGRAPVSAAAGELTELDPGRLGAWLPAGGLELLKCGFAGSGADWRARAADLLTAAGGAPRCVPVAYADWRAAGAPPPWAVAGFAAESGCRWVLVDTFDKSRGGLLEVFSLPAITELLSACRSVGLRVGLAGKLSADDLGRLAPLRPDVLGVRGAACEAGRETPIRSELVGELRRRCDLTAARSADPGGAQKNLTPAIESGYSARPG